MSGPLLAVALLVAGDGPLRIENIPSADLGMLVRRPGDPPMEPLRGQLNQPDHQAALLRCHARSRRRGERFQSVRLDITVRIDKRGRVEKVWIEALPGVSAVAGCFRQVIGRWRFPANGAGYQSSSALLLMGASSDPSQPPDPRKPKPLSRLELFAEMNRVLPTARLCPGIERSNGRTNLKVTIDARGAVARVTLSGPLVGTPAGICVEQAIAAARFRASPGETFDWPMAGP